MTLLNPGHLSQLLTTERARLNFAVGDAGDAFDGMDRREINRFLRAERRRMGIPRGGAAAAAFEGRSAEEIERIVEGEVDERDPRHPKYAHMTDEEKRQMVADRKPKKLGQRIRTWLGWSSDGGKRKKAVGDGGDDEGGAKGSEKHSGDKGGVDRAESAAGAGVDDEFEGLSPEEIDVRMAARGA